MNANGFNIAEQGHVCNLLPPIDITGGATILQVFSMENYAHASIIVQFGVTASAATKIIINECTSAAGAGATAIAHAIYKCETGAGSASGDVLGARTAVATAGTTPSATDNIFYCIEINANELSDGYEWVQLAITAPAASILCSAVAVLSGSRYALPQSATAIA
jgi:hypothetical protein